MATMLLSTLGNAVGGALGPTGALLGRAAGAALGGMIDQQLFGTKGANREGPRLKTLDVQSSTEGASMPRLYGRARLSGQVIWATRFEEVKTTQSTGGGKGAGSQGGSSTTTYSYYANFAVAVCQGQISHFGRIWADGKLLDPSLYTIRSYKGSQTQQPDSLIEAHVGVGKAPAYRGTAYVVFERMALAAFGNRLPQLSFEVVRGVGALEQGIKAVCIIPGATEFGYDTVRVVSDLGDQGKRAENTHLHGEITDWTLSIDELCALCPNLKKVGIVVSWFGNDLRCGACSVRPGVEEPSKITIPYSWSVNGVGRGQAHQISRKDNRASFGGTPSDASVLRAIADLKARGLEVVFYPFLLMDIPADNTLPNPYGGASQPAFPWRGEITTSLAPNMVGTADNTAAALNEVNAFLGNAQPNQLSVNGQTVSYTGAADWGYRRMVLHYAKLCAVAGGVKAFLLGTELRGLTQIRDSRLSFPFVDALKQLASEVRVILPSAKLSYAADWSEYASYQPQDGEGDVVFPLDRLWGDANIDFIGIDNYLPLSDWREGEGHLDADMSERVENLDYLRHGISNGEYADWYYASDADRASQSRTLITDGDYNKPWVYSAKRLQDWWQHPHFERLGGVEVATPTAWQPQSKPIWFTELGCPALDKGSNQPNVYFDPKSANSALPYFSSGQRNDDVQRSFLTAHKDHWQIVANNPVSSVYGGAMVDADSLFLWAWDARPYPVFPFALSVWSDGDNWQRGHWLNGRLGACPLNELLQAIHADASLAIPIATDLYGSIEGYVLDRPMSFRQAVSPLAELFSFSAYEKGQEVQFAASIKVQTEIDVEQLVPNAQGSAIQDLRAQASETAGAFSLAYIDPMLDYQNGSVLAKSASFEHDEAVSLGLPAVMSRTTAHSLAQQWLMRQKTSNSRVIVLPPTDLRHEVGDVVRFKDEAALWRIVGLEDGATRRLSLARLNGAVALGASAVNLGLEPSLRAEPGSIVAEVLDLPNLDEQTDAPTVHLAAFSRPWPGRLSVYETSGEATSFVSVLEAPATLGTTLNDLPKGVLWRYDTANSLEVQLLDGQLQSVTDEELLNGANAMALKTPQGAWEIIQFGKAELIGARRYRLSRLLRGQKGTEDTMQDLLPQGQRLVLLDSDLLSLPMRLDGFNTQLQFKIGPSERSYDHDSFIDVSGFWGARSLLPLFPVHVRVKRQSTGLNISFVRRTRLGGDSWAFETQPLGEASEAYDLRILDGSDQVVFSANLTQPNLLYTQELAHFGSAQSALKLHIAQRSVSMGAGVAFTGLVPVS